MRQSWVLLPLFLQQKGVSRLLGIRAQISGDGKLLFIACLQPLSFAGSLIQRAFFDSRQQIVDLNPGIGDLIQVSSKNGFVQIKALYQKVNPVSCCLPLYCPCCSYQLVNKHNDVYCPNVDCDDQVLIQLKHDCAALNLANYSDYVILGLMRHGIRNIRQLLSSDLFFLKPSLRKRMKKSLLQYLNSR